MLETVDLDDVSQVLPSIHPHEVIQNHLKRFAVEWVVLLLHCIVVGRSLLVVREFVFVE